MPNSGSSLHPEGSTEPDHHHHARPWTREQALDVLESPDRATTQSADLLWSRAQLRPGDVVVDVGAGTGYYSLPAARRVGRDGHVYAVDLSEDLVALIQERAQAEQLKQLTGVQSSPTRIPLPSAVADVVLLANVLHDIPESTLAEAVRLLKSNGRFVNVDWKKESTPGGPPLSIRMNEEEATKWLGAQGLTLVERWELGPYHYGLNFRRRGDKTTD